MDTVQDKLPLGTAHKDILSKQAKWNRLGMQKYTQAKAIQGRLKLARSNHPQPF